MTTHEERLSLVEAFIDYLRRRGQSPLTLRNRESYARRFVSELDPTRVMAFEIEEWIFSQGWNPQTINSAVTALRRFFLWLLQSGKRSDNPTLELRTVQLPRRRPRVASDETIAEGLRSSDLTTQVMILLAAECGLRRAEIARVHRDDIDGAWLKVHGKGGHERLVFLPDNLLSRIARMPGRGWLFPSVLRSPQRTHGTYAMFQAGCRDADACPGHPSTGKSCRQADRDAKARYRHGIKQIRVDTTQHVTPGWVGDRIHRAVGNAHSLRHRAATAVYRGTGNDLRVTQEFLGHSSPAMTAKYVHVSDNDLRLAAMAAHIDIAS